MCCLWDDYFRVKVRWLEQGCGRVVVWSDDVLELILELRLGGLNKGVVWQGLQSSAHMFKSISKLKLVAHLTLVVDRMTCLCPS